PAARGCTSWCRSSQRWTGIALTPMRGASPGAWLLPRRRYVTSAALASRPGRLFINYLRNGRGTTAVGAYSPRARPGFPVAARVTWRQIEHGLRSDAFSIGQPPRAAELTS